MGGGLADDEGEVGVGGGGCIYSTTWLSAVKFQHFFVADCIVKVCVAVGIRSRFLLCHGGSSIPFIGLLIEGSSDMLVLVRKVYAIRYICSIVRRGGPGVGVWCVYRMVYYGIAY